MNKFGLDFWLLPFVGGCMVMGLGILAIAIEGLLAASGAGRIMFAIGALIAACAIIIEWKTEDE